MRDAARRLARGFMIVIDYGHEARELYSASPLRRHADTFSRHRSAGAESGGRAAVARRARRAGHHGARRFHERARRRRSGRARHDSGCSIRPISARPALVARRRSATGGSRALALKTLIDARRPRQHAEGADPRQGRRRAGADGHVVPGARHMNAGVLASSAIMIVSEAATLARIEPFWSWNTPICLDRLHPVRRRRGLAGARQLVDPFRAARIRGARARVDSAVAGVRGLQPDSSTTGTTPACPTTLRCGSSATRGRSRRSGRRSSKAAELISVAGRGRGPATGEPRRSEPVARPSDSPSAQA